MKGKNMTGRFIILFLMLSSMASAQKLESGSEFYTGYLTTSNFDQDNTIKSIDGVLYMIYEDIPIALVRYPAMNTASEYEVPSTVRRICNNAFQGTKYLKTLKLHNRVTEGTYVSLMIGEKAFNDSSIENFVVIENDQKAATHVIEKATTKRKEVARHDLSGQKVVNTNTEGVQIVSYDDKTAKKVLNKNK